MYNLFSRTLNIVSDASSGRGVGGEKEKKEIDSVEKNQ